MAVIGMLCLAGCGGGGSALGGTSPPITGAASNVQAVTVDTGPAVIASSNQPDVNTLFTTVTICAPGSTTSCQTIDHIQVDTGSSGFRVLASVLTLALPQQVDTNNNAVVECTKFVDGYSWGPVRKADVKIAGEAASNAAIQVIGDPAYPTVPSDCSSSGTLTAEDTVQSFGANGILGVGPFISDCGPACTVAQNGSYFTCPATGTCGDIAITEAAQVSNPVAAFATDNNGVIIELPSVAAAGSAAVSGSLVFGIGTQSNNGLGSATAFTLNASDGSLSTLYKGTSLTDSFIDSGSNAYYFPDSSIDICASTTSAPGFFCPAATLSLTATMQGANGSSSVVAFSVANADNLFNTNATIGAANDLAAPGASASSANSGFDASTSFDWGLPFYFGRNVYTAIENHSVAGVPGPYFAF
jgi:hypothetical protein